MTGIRRRAAVAFALGVALFAGTASMAPAYGQNVTPKQVIQTDLYAISRDHQGVYHNLGGTTWEKIGGPAGTLYSGEGQLFATNPTTGKIYHWLGGTRWEYFGEPGADFCVTREQGRITLIGLRPDHSAIYERELGWTGWQKIGGEAGSIVCADPQGRNGGIVMATNPHTGDLWLNNGLFTLQHWGRIGGPGRQFVANGNSVYGLSPGGQRVMAWTKGNPGTLWTQIGNAAGKLYAGGVNIQGVDNCPQSCVLLATNPHTGGVYGFTFPTGWSRIGGPGRDFAISHEGIVYGLSPDGTRVFEWNGEYDPDETHWDLVGPNGAAQIAAA